MQAVEFKSKPHDNVVDLPRNLRDWNNRPVRVILLADEDTPYPVANPAFTAVSLKTREYRFNREDANAR